MRKNKENIKLPLAISFVLYAIAIFGGAESLKKTFSQTQFETAYKITYDIGESGETLVTQEIEITNKDDDVLVTVYSFILSQMNIYDVSGFDTAGQLEVDVKRDGENNRTTISAPLKDQVIGKGRSSKINISYKTSDLANKVGEIWNVNLPKPSNLEEIAKYEVIIKVPQAFGPQIYIAPTPSVTGEENNKTVYSYSKQDIENKSITATFGKNQILNFELKYDLLNNTFLPRRQSIALPPDIAKHQQIYFSSIEPKPTFLKKDTDGNIMATFWIKPNQAVQVIVRGSAKIFGNQISPEMGGKMHEIPSDLKKLYTKADTYWEVENSKIKDLALELFDPKKNVAQNAYEAYKYVVENLEYDTEITQENTIQRHGALKALTQKGAWACMEFTDLFIALTRAMGIPARELNGFAFSEGESIVPTPVDFNTGDMLHAWAEFYDPNFGWVQVDPTWGNTSGIDYFTKLDTNHLAFVVKGVSSEEPYPAGAYRLDTNQKQINVDFAEKQIDFEPKLEFKKAIPWNLLKIFQGKRRYVVTHKEGPILYGVGGENSKRIIFPFSKESVYLERSANVLEYRDFGGNLEKISM
ncbi:transglutaminase domain-containing protein [Patescibacteria group bacterium]|nr:transglutaminase domain-containing protein [Patescibacteria group bacterium]